MKTEDLQKLKALALVAKPRQAYAEFAVAANPDAVLELITLAERGILPEITGTEKGRIRATALACGFTIKDGLTDLKPYVYEFAQRLLAERAIAEPAASVDTPEFRALMLRWASDWCRAERANDAIAHINAWGAAQREAGRCEIGEQMAEAMREDAALILKERRCAEAAEAELAARPDPSVHFNGFDIDKLPPILISCVAKLWPGSNGLFWETALEKMPGRIERLMARPAVDMVLRSRVADILHLLEHLPFTSDGDLEQARKAMADVRSMLSQPAASAPTGCSKDPACCPNNEGYGCDCSAIKKDQSYGA